MATITKSDLVTAIEFAGAVGRAVKDAGPLGVGEGVLVGWLLPHCSAEYVRGAIRLLVNQGIIRQQGYKLTWVGEGGVPSATAANCSRSDGG
jgi:hypothetical protein